MKIQELFLTENQPAAKMPRIEISVECVDGRTPKDSIEHFSSRIVPKLSTYGFTNVKCTADKENFEIAADIPTHDALKHTESAYRECMDQAEKYDDVNYAQYKVVSLWPALFDLHFAEQVPELHLTLTKPTQVKDLAKTISEVDLLSIINTKYISGGLLSFLRFNALNDVEFQDEKDQHREKAMDIVRKRLKGDKNVLNCQEELIDAGLEEYAQL